MKTCPNCRFSNSDRNRFCSRCDTSLPLFPDKGSADVQSEAAPMAYPEHFRKTWRIFVASPLMILLFVVFTFSQVRTILAWGEQAKRFEETIQSLGTTVDLGRTAIIVMVLQLVLMAPGIITALGMWFMYADTRSAKTTPICTVGLKMIMGAMIAMIVIYSLLIALLLLAGFMGLVSMNTANGVNVVLLALTIVGVAIGFELAIQIVALAQLRAARRAVQNCRADNAWSVGLAVLLFVNAGINVLFGSDGLLSVNGLLNVGFPILCGVVLYKYKDMMNALHSQRYQFILQEKEQKENL